MTLIPEDDPSKFRSFFDEDEKDNDIVFFSNYTVADDPSWETLPDAVADYYGFYAPNGRFHQDTAELTEEERGELSDYLLALPNGDDMVDSIRLTDMNDKGATFQDIARFIRKFPAVIFKEPK